MKKLAVLFASMFIFAIAVQNLNAQATSATDNAAATARIITPITLNNTQGLAFGNIASSSALGTVTISPANVRTSAGGVTPSAIGTFNNAIFVAGGEPNATYTITLPTSVTVTSGANNMTVTGWTSNPSGNGLLSGIGEQTINVGATLNVAANQATGDYSGSFDVTIAYN